MAMLRPSIHLLCLTTICWLALSPVYTIQPVVKPVVKPVWQPVKCLYTRYNRLSNRLSNRFDNRLYRVYKHSTGCQTRLTTGFDNRLYRVNRGLTLTNNRTYHVNKHPTGCKTGFWQPVGCLFTGYSRLLYRLYNGFDNRLYRANGVLGLTLILIMRRLFLRRLVDFFSPTVD